MVAMGQSVQMHRADPGQVYLLDQDSDPGCLDDLRQRWVLPADTLVPPRVDFRRLARAMEKLMARHDGLRIRFDRVKGRLMAIIDPPEPPPIRRIDLGDMDDATFQASIRDIANAPMPPPGCAEDVTAFWARMHRDVPPAPPIGRKAKGLDPLWRAIGRVDARRLAVSTSAKGLTRTDARANRVGLDLTGRVAA